MFRNRLRGKSNTNFSRIYNALKDIIKIHKNFKNGKIK